MDRSVNGPVMVASPKGGMDIEAVAEETPNLIFKQPISIEAGPTAAQTEGLAKKIGFTDVKTVCCVVGGLTVFSGRRANATVV